MITHFLTPPFARAAAPLASWGYSDRLSGRRRASAPASPVNARLNFAVTLVGIRPSPHFREVAA
jgi:hypothetical protein